VGQCGRRSVLINVTFMNPAQHRPLGPLTPFGMLITIN
jgi:hypothetical protein